MPYRPNNIISRVIGNMFAKKKEGGYRVRDDQRKLVCPHLDYTHAFIVLPQEWLGEHAIRKDRALQLANEHGSPEISNFAICMSILDDWGNIPGLDEKAPDKWDFNIVPIPIISWVVETVLADFSLAYVVPKALSQPSMALSQEAEVDTAGNSEKKE